YLRKAHGAGLPMGGVVGLGPVVTVADVVECDFVALNVGPCQPGHVRLPIALVSRRKGQPPNEDAGQEEEEEAKLAPVCPNKYEPGQQCDREQSRRRPIACAEWSIEPDGAEPPGRADEA